MMGPDGPAAIPRVVPVELPTAYRQELVAELSGLRQGRLADLKAHALKADKARRQAQCHERLIEALDRGSIELPDEEARDLMQDLADGLDREEDWEQLKLRHDSRHALLAVLVDGGDTSGGSAATGFTTELATDAD